MNTALLNRSKCGAQLSPAFHSPTHRLSPLSLPSEAVKEMYKKFPPNQIRKWNKKHGLQGLLAMTRLWPWSLQSSGLSYKFADLLDSDLPANFMMGVLLTHDYRCAIAMTSQRIWDIWDAVRIVKLRRGLLASSISRGFWLTHSTLID
jgi:hypothetical protein